MRRFEQQHGRFGLVLHVHVRRDRAGGADSCRAGRTRGRSRGTSRAGGYLAARRSRRAGPERAALCSAPLLEPAAAMIRVVALLLTVLTGFSGLVYEVTWQKYLATLLGSHSEATAAVLGLFLGGLAIGYSLFGALTRRLVARAQRPGRGAPLLLVYGAVESSASACSRSPFPGLFRAVQALSFLLPHANPGLGFALDVALSPLLVLPPAILMGGTIPDPHAGPGARSRRRHALPRAGLRLQHRRRLRRRAGRRLLAGAEPGPGRRAGRDGRGQPHGRRPVHRARRAAPAGRARSPAAAPLTLPMPRDTPPAWPASPPSPCSPASR